jgi:hypothetical protein
MARVRGFSPKQEYEEYFIRFNFFRLLGGDTITTATVTVEDADGEDVTDTFTDALQQYIEGTRVFAWVKGGTPQRYLVTCRITTGTGKKWEMDGYLEVVENQT